LIDAKFVDFGDDRLFPFPTAPLGRITAKRLSEMRKLVQTRTPKLPGVYGMIDARQRLTYVGKSKSLRGRLLTYFLPNQAEEKQGRIVESARQIVWEVQPSEFAALLREQALIRHWTPRWNVQGIPQRQRPVYLCLGRSPATFYLSRLPDPKALGCEGPFQGARRMSRIVEVLNQHFRLRDCGNRQKMHFADQLSLFDVEQRPGCLRFEIGTCLGPCVGGCSRTAYQKQVLHAQRFLSGDDCAPLDKLRDGMRTAAKLQQFELASRERNDLVSLEYLQQKLTLLARARREYSFIYAAPAPADRSVWYLIAQGQVIDAIPAPLGARALQKQTQALGQWRERLRLGEETNYMYTLPLVAAWFRKYPEELRRTFLPEEAPAKYRDLLHEMLEQAV
jgi:excinuclease ABC subunit C